MIGIIDYGMGNLLSVYSAIDYLGEKVVICSHPEELSKVDRIIIPGVGAFKDCLTLLKRSGFIDVLNEEVIKKGKPTLGICLGMQAMARKSYEFGEHEGLGWFDAEVIKIQTYDSSLKLPNIGWNEIEFIKKTSLFSNIPDKSDFYFVHSYYMNCSEQNDVIAIYKFGNINITAAVKKDNILATQFHPEKSQDFGLKLLINFINWKP